MLYGFLGRQFGKVHRYKVNTPAEAVKAMCATIKGFRKALVDGGSYKVLIGGKQRIDIDEVTYPVSDKETIRFIPLVEGSGDAGKIILGVALIAFAPQLFVALGGVSGGAFAAFAASAATNIGFSLILGGIAQLLFAPPEPAGQTGTREAATNTPSFVFDGAVNTVAQGHPVPVCYGKLIVGSQVISAGLSVEQLPTT